MKKALLLLTLTLFAVSIHAQKGIIRGSITDAAIGEALTGATIVVPGTTYGIISDLDGIYNLSLEPGIYSLRFSFISYESKVYDEIRVEPGKTTEINVVLYPSTTEIEEIVVSAEMRKKSEAAIQVMQKNSAVVMDGISAQQISRLGDSDAAGALKRVTGISVQDGKYIYVRGLSDRYVKVTLNGAEVPGLDPNINTVQMDLFPGNILENITVNKTFSPEYSSFTAGLINVSTKDFPSKFSFQASAGTQLNSITHFNSGFLSYKGGKLDWLGISDRTRDLPQRAKGVDVPSINSESAKNIEEISQSFNDILSVQKTKASPDMSYSLSFGDQKSFENRSSLGYIAAVSYKQESTMVLNGRLDDYEASSASSVQASELLSENVGTYNATWSVLLGMNYKINARNKIGFNLLRNQNGQKQAKFMEGNTYESDSYAMQKYSLEYLERTLSSYQVSGHHELPGLNNAKISWISSFNHSIQNSPDTRFFINELVFSGEDTLYFVRSNRKPERRYRDMWETNWHTRLDLSLPVNLINDRSTIKTGISYLTKFRNSDENRFTINTLSSFVYNGNPSTYTRSENIVSAEDYSHGVYYDNDFFTNGYLSFTGKDIISAAYLMADISPISKLRIVAGLRIEKTSSVIENKVDTIEFSRPSQKKKYVYYEPDAVFDPLPSINISYSLTENMKLRLGLNQSIGRPSFRERAPYLFYEYTEGTNIQGNPELKRGLVNNYDLRWEYFFKPGEMISVSAFYKNINDPIERYKVPSTGNLTTYRNGLDSYLYGMELEIRKSLDFMSALKDFEIGANISFIKSVSPVDTLRLRLARENVPGFPSIRPLFGQSPYIVNGFLSYSNPISGISGNIAFNVEGPKIVIINKFQTPDVYERPFANLNLNMSKYLGNHFTVKTAIKNLLNKDFRQSLRLENGEEYSFRKYSVGRTFSIGLVYNFE